MKKETVVRKGAGERRKAAPLDKVVGRPAMRVFPNGEQVGFNRDLLAALGRPTHVVWIEIGRRPKLQIRLKASMAAEKDAYQITYYPRRSCGAGTLPKKLRDDFPPGTHVLAFAWNDGVWFTLEKKGDPHA